LGSLKFMKTKTRLKIILGLAAIAATIYYLFSGPYTITASINPPEGGVVFSNPEAQTYNAGTSITVTAKANPGYIFTEWTGVPQEVKGLFRESITFAIKGNTKLTANFQPSSIYYGGETYELVKIRSQIWFNRNLNFEPLNIDANSWCYDNKPANCAKYGRLYDWATAMNLWLDCNVNSCEDQIQQKHQGICPKGFHIPSKAEYELLENILGKYLKASSGWSGWDWDKNKEISGNGNDIYGFSALPGGMYMYHSPNIRDYKIPGMGRGRFTIPSNFSNAGGYGWWWSTSEGRDKYDAFSLKMSYDNENCYLAERSKSQGFSVRCLKD